MDTNLAEGKPTAACKKAADVSWDSVKILLKRVLYFLQTRDCAVAPAPDLNPQQKLSNNFSLEHFQSGISQETAFWMIQLKKCPSCSCDWNSPRGALYQAASWRFSYKDENLKDTILHAAIHVNLFQRLFSQSAWVSAIYVLFFEELMKYFKLQFC